MRGVGWEMGMSPSQIIGDESLIIEQFDYSRDSSRVTNMNIAPSEFRTGQCINHRLCIDYES
jgi:hypothetical protein